MKKLPRLPWARITLSAFGVFVLLVLAIPTPKRPGLSARKVIAFALTTNLPPACEAYYSEYNSYPPYKIGSCLSTHVIHSPEEWETLCIILNGNLTYSGQLKPPIPGANPRNISFFDQFKKHFA